MAEYIERQALLDKLKERDLCLCVTEQDIKDAPAADVSPVRHGRWIQGNGYVECSECNTIGSPHWKCCPVCTAMMDLEE